jgi:dTDP-4-dehydrorhamnose reductase
MTRRGALPPSPVILLTGADGQVGWEVQRAVSQFGSIVALRRSDVDLADSAALRNIVRQVRPTIIVNAAAYTSVDQAEDERTRAFAVNADAPALLAEEAAKLGALLVHYSSDYVFDGENLTPYSEQDPTRPLGVYGASKLAGEEAVAAAGGRHVILRTSWVYASRGRNFLQTMRRLARERDEMRVVDDQVGVPTSARLVANVTALVLARGQDPAVPTDNTGLYHLAARGTTTWFGFAQRILALDPDRAEHRCHDITPIPTAAYPTRAPRPRYSVLDTAKLERTFHVRMPEWTDQLELVMSEVGR